MKAWDAPSVVTLEVQEYDEDECCLKVHQTGLPSTVSAQTMKGGWTEQIFRPMSLLLGYPILNQD